MARDLILAIETSNPSAWEEGAGWRPGVCVARAGPGGTLQVLAVEAVAPDRPHDDDLLPAIDRAVRAAGGAPREVARVCVSVGPGGFTAVRLAVTAAKMIAEVTGAACVPVPSAWVVARRAVDVGARFAVALASKHDSAWVTIFGSDSREERAGRIMRWPEVAAARVDLLIADRFLPGSWRDGSAEAGVRVAAPVFDPAACAEVGAALEPVDPLRLAPMYPREPEAVTKWRERHGPGGSPGGRA